MTKVKLLLFALLSAISARAITVDTPGVNYGGGVRYTVHYDGGSDSVVVKTRIGTDTLGTSAVLDTLVDHFEDGGAPSGEATFDVSSSLTEGKNVFYYFRNTGSPGTFGYLGPFYGTGGTDPIKDWVSVNIQNSYSYAIKVRILNGSGTAIWTSGALTPGQTVQHNEDVTGRTDGPFKVGLLVPSSLGDGIWEARDLDSGTTIPIGTALEVREGSTEPDFPPATPLPDPGTEGIPQANGVNTEGGTQVSIWNAPTGSTVDAERLDKLTFKQGTDRLEKAIGDSAKKIVTAVGAGNAKLDAIGTKLDALKTNADEQATAKAANPGAGVAAGQGSTAKSEATSLFGTVPSSLGYTPGSGTAPVLAVTMPEQFGGKTFDLNPFTESRLGGVAAWFRSACAWLAIVTLGVWVWSEIGSWVRGLSNLRQAQGNAVVGGTGAQATALVAATAITVAVVAGVAALLAWGFSGINLGTLLGSVSTNPLVGIPATVLWMLDTLLPVGTIITCVVARMCFNLYASSVFAGAAAVVRFIVP